MSDHGPDTTQLHGWLDRVQAGDLAARDELLRSVGNRLERLARKMLGRFPDVHRWVETDDVLQNALLRLLKALEDVRPASMRAFFGLAAEQMRRELLDLARYYYGPHGHGAHHATHGPGPEPTAPAEDPEGLERWCTFHQEVGWLPAEEREVVGQIFCHGWKQADVARLFGVSERTVRRRWESAMLKLHRLLKDEGPER
jgi:RNA polymerase sigma-70 factor (ECF subfamily)